MGAAILPISAPVAHAPVPQRRPPAAAQDSLPAVQKPAAQISHAASAVALAPTAMVVLLQAQEHGDRPQAAAARAQSVQQIDRLISRLSDSPPPPAPQTQQGAGVTGRFSMDMLVAARQQLTQIWA